MRGPLGGGVMGGGSALRPPVLVAPLLHQLAAVGVPVAIVVDVALGTPSATATFGANPPIALSIVGTQATGSFTPAGGDVSAELSLTVEAAGFTVESSIDVEADFAFWIDASNPASYTAAGEDLTAVKSLITGTELNTVVGAPKVVTSPIDGLPAFQFAAGPDYLLGTDAAFQAAVTGTDKAWCSLSVVNITNALANGSWSNVANAASASIGQQLGQQSAGVFFGSHAGALGYKQASGKAAAGTAVIAQRSLDGLTVYTSINGGPETATVLTSAGAITVTRVGVGSAVQSTPNLPYNGLLREQVFFSSGKSEADMQRMSLALLEKWPPSPQVQAVGDSITTAQLANNGGMVALLAAKIEELGGFINPQGPIAQANGALGAVFFPFRYSAASGDSCEDMTTRVTSATQGLGSTAGHYLETELVMLFAGTNSSGSAAATAAAYATLLDDIYTRLMEGNPTARISVTTITQIAGSEAYVSDYNALLPAIWNAFDAAHPLTPLIRWNAFAACPSGGGRFLDGTHPSDAGYVAMCEDPENGLFQAVTPYLLSVQ